MVKFEYIRVYRSLQPKEFYGLTNELYGIVLSRETMYERKSFHFPLDTIYCISIPFLMQFPLDDVHRATYKP